jgi:hypothetical protein
MIDNGKQSRAPATRSHSARPDDRLPESHAGARFRNEAERHAKIRQQRRVIRLAFDLAKAHLFSEDGRAIAAAEG